MTARDDVLVSRDHANLALSDGFAPDASQHRDPIAGSATRVEKVAALPLARHVPASGLMGRRKRAFDVIVSGAALALLSPIMALIALIIALDSPGAVVFSQRRSGQGGRVFKIFKFRTMTVMEDGATVVQATRRDARVTRVGRFLRRTSLDELPQLMNVLRGEMSLVGPRPHALAHDDYYAARISDYALRYDAKPGMTGLAQVTGWRGQTETLDKMVGRVRQDLRYVRTWSFVLDVQIMVRTVLVVLQRQKAH